MKPNAGTEDPTRQRPLRLWPGVALVLILWLGRLVLPLFGSMAAAIGALAAPLCWLGIVVWWAFFSRAPRFERWAGVALMIVALVATRTLVDISIATAGMGVSFFLYATSFLSLAFVVWAVASQRLSQGPRRVTMVLTILLACGAWALLRMDGITGDGSSTFNWRWAETHEERLLAEAADGPTAGTAAPTMAADTAEWPGFRGGERNSVIRGVRIATDWSESPPVELWRRPIGPGWSSFAVAGDLLYTQEQRGDDEVVACYRVSTGEPVWKHKNPVRFWDSHAGAGPRATPALSDGRVYALGATGILNALGAAAGTVQWSRDVASDTGKEAPGWGFTSSPLIVGDVVVVHVGMLVAYDLATGELRWRGPDRGGSYSSPHLATIDGVPQIVMMGGAGAVSVAPADGALLWEYSGDGASIVQPASAANGDLLISTASTVGPSGIHRVTVSRANRLNANAELRGSGGWTTEERWATARLKPYFSDFVVHEGHAYGFDGRILAAIDLEDGERKWKGGRFGSGQMVLLPDQDLLIVVSEKGELALVEATPQRFSELARFPAVEGKTWNHPVLVGDRLLVRNSQEMVAFRLTLAEGA